MSIDLFNVLWLVLFGGALVIWLVMFPATQRHNPLAIFRASTASYGEVNWRSLCGVRYPLSQGGTMTVSMPLARVVCTTQGVAISASSPLSHFAVPSWRFRWSDLRLAEAVGANGVRLRPLAVDAPVVLRLMSSRKEFLDLLEGAGVRVERRPQRTGWWSI